MPWQLPKDMKYVKVLLWRKNYVEAADFFICRFGCFDATDQKTAQGAPVLQFHSRHILEIVSDCLLESQCR